MRKLSKIWIRWYLALWHEGNLWTWSQIWPLIYKTSSLNHCALSRRIKCEKMKHDIVWLMILTLYIRIFYTWLKPKDFLKIIYYLGCIWHTQKYTKNCKKFLLNNKDRNLITKNQLTTCRNCSVSFRHRACRNWCCVRPPSCVIYIERFSLSACNCLCWNFLWFLIVRRKIYYCKIHVTN